MEISSIRVLGFVVGLAALFFLFKRLRVHSQQRSDVWGILLLGGGLLALSLFPNLASVPSDLFSLGDVRGGRIIALLILGVFALSLITISSRNTLETMKVQLDRFIQSSLAVKFMEENRAAISESDILVLMPAYNEEENLPGIIPAIPKDLGGRRVRILVINDGSTDGTEKAARQAGALVVSHPFNRGGGAALRTGYAVAERAGVGIIVTMDGDGQHAPAEIATLLQPILDNQADFVIGSRILGGYDSYSSLRILGVHLFNKIINVLMGTKVTDCASGFRAIRISALGRISLMQDQYHTSELIIDAAKKGLRIAERPIHIAARMHGYSKKGRSLAYAFGFLRTVLVTWWR